MARSRILLSGCLEPSPEPGAPYLALFAGLVTVGFLSAVAFHWAQHTVFHFGFPRNTYLFDPKDRFNDWHNSVLSASTRDPYVKRGPAIPCYFPFAYFAFRIGAGLTRRASELVYFATSATVLLTGVGVFWKSEFAPRAASVRGRVLSLVLLLVVIAVNYPLHFSIDRGNIDVWIGGLALIFCGLHDTRFRALGAVALGAAIALKGYPAAFCLLLLLERRYGQIVLALVAAGALTVASLLTLDGSVVHQLEGFRRAFAAFQMAYVLGPASLHYSSDPYNMLRLLSVQGLIPLDQERIFELYRPVALLYALATTWFVVLVPSERWKKILAISLLAVLYPNVANDYKLLVLLPGIFAFLSSAPRSWVNGSVGLALAVAVIPKAYWYVRGDANVGCFIAPVCLLWVLRCIFPPWRSCFPGLEQTLARVTWFLTPLLPKRVFEALRAAPSTRGFVLASSTLPAL